MTLVTAQMSLSLGGFYAGPKHAEMDGWMESREAAAFFRITRWVVGAMAWRERQGLEGGEHDTNSEILEETFESAGAYVMGRRMADGREVPWGHEPPFHAPVFVVTHRARNTLVRDAMGYLPGSHRSGLRAFVNIFRGEPDDLLSRPELAGPSRSSSRSRRARSRITTA